MPDFSTTKSLVGLGILLGLSWVLLAFNIARALQSTGSTYSTVIVVAIPIMLGLALIIGASAIVVYDLGDHLLHIAEWTVFGIFSLLVAAILNLIGIPFIHLDFTLIMYVILNSAAGGAVMGLLIGLYSAYQRELRSELAAEHSKAKNLSEQLGVLNRVLRHDIRNQAQIIHGEVEKLRRNENDTEEVAIRIQERNEELIDLSDEARKLEALLSGENYGSEKIDVVSSIENAVESVRSSHPELTIEYDRPEDLVVHTSPLLDDVLEHLLTNAAEHNDSERPHATISVEEVPSSALPIQITVADNGPGIPDSEPILSNDPSESPMDHSNGFGLWFVQWVIDATGGDLEIEKYQGRTSGTAVTLKLPSAL